MRYQATALAVLASIIWGGSVRAADEPAPGVAVDVLLDTARAYALRARWDDAERLIERALPLAAEAQDARRETRLRIQLARVLSSRATYKDLPLERALSLSEETVTVSRALKDPELLGDALHGWAVCRYDYQFRVPKPDHVPIRQALSEALALREQQKDPSRLAETLFYLGLVHERLDENPQAKATYERALEVVTPAGDKVMMAYLYRHLADFQKPERGLAGVLEYHRRCLRLREEADFATGIIFASVAVGETLLEMKQPDQALPHYERALAVAREIDVARGAAYAHLGLAAVHQAAGRPERAREHAREALAAAARSQDRDVIGQVLKTTAPILGPAAK